MIIKFSLSNKVNYKIIVAIAKIVNKLNNL